MKTFPGVVRSKLPQVGTTIFTVMSALARQHNAINLSQGFPDFEVSAKLIDLIHHYMKKGYNQYAPMQGVMELREVIAKKVGDLYGANYHPETEITITAGGTQAIYAAIAAFVGDGDQVIVPEPAYDCYVPAIRLSGGMPVFSRLRTPDYHIDWDEIQKMVNRNTRMIIINTPHNPTGSVLGPEDLKQLQRITRNTDIIVLSDEVYEHLIFDGLQHESVCRYPSLAERSIAVYSFGKTFHATGWKTGYVLAPSNLMAEFRKAHQFIVFACNTPLQYALADFLSDPSNYNYLPSFYQEKRDQFLKMISSSRFGVVPSGGTYFQLLSYEGITDEKEMDFAVRLTKEFGIASVPVSVFYNQSVENKNLRFCFAKKEETLEKAAEILCRI
jgi:methionine transaminase